MKSACVFPGQGSQSVKMLDALAQAYPLVQQRYEQAGELLGCDLWRYVQQGPAEELNNTEITQPAMLVAGYVVWELLQQHTPFRPAFVAGHSLGEYTALACAGAISFADAVELVSYRGRFMQQAVAAGQGAMAAVLGLDDQAVIDACAGAAQQQVVSAVNFNTPGQVVIAGDRPAVERALEACRAAGAKKTVMLPVSVPSHCELMKPAADELALKLEAVEIRMPEIPVLHNCNVEVSADTDAIRQALVQQLYRPVRWVELINRLKDEGVGLIVESGPGRVLTGLCRRIDRKLQARAVYDPESLAALANEKEEMS